MALDTIFFKQKLEEEKVKLEKELGTVGRKNPENPDDWEATPSELEPETDPIDEADRVEEFEGRAAVENTLEMRLRDVLRALDKIKSGTYGVCNADGAPHSIEEGRLRANPAARNCMKHMKEWGK